MRHEIDDRSDPNCLFCKIIAGKIPCAKVYEDESVIAFLDIQPNNKGHTLVVPRAHEKNFIESDTDDLADIMSVCQGLAPAIMAAVKAEGINLIANTNAAAGQAVFHTHFHLIPRFANDGYKHWPHAEYASGEAESVAAKIRENLQ